jgi:selenocysteine lyase/cysteine desulfurase
VALAHAVAPPAAAREKLAGLPGARVLDAGRHLAAIATVAFEGCDADSIVARLREQAINTSATFRDYAVLDMDRKHATSAIRVSPHYYNTRRDIETLVFALEEFAPPGD